MNPRRFSSPRSEGQRHSSFVQWLVLATDERLQSADADALARRYGLDALMVEAELAREQMRRAR